MAVLIHRLDWEGTPKPLGRHVEHDERSRGFAHLPRDVMPKGINSFFQSPVGPLNQGDVGSCTGNAEAQWLNTDYALPVREQVNKGQPLGEPDALKIYSLGTHLDNIRGNYPPIDTGCSGLGVAKAGVKLGFLQGYSHIFTWQAFQATAEVRPFIAGTLWTNTMFNAHNGLVRVGSLRDSNIAGGHEYLVCGIDWAAQVVILRNSWGDRTDIDPNGWPGCKPGGYFAISFREYQALLDAQGDGTVLQGTGMAA